MSLVSARDREDKRALCRFLTYAIQIWEIDLFSNVVIFHFNMGLLHMEEV